MSVTLGDAAVYITGSDKGLSDSLDHAQRRTQNFLSSLGGVLNNALGVALGNTIQQGFARIDQAIRGAISTGFQAVAQNEQLKLSYESLIASQLKAADSTMSMADALAAGAPMAKELYDWTIKLGVKSPFSEQAISKSLQMAQGFKFNTQMAKQLTSTLVDTAAATGRGGESIEAATRALGQMNAKGKVSQEELNQLSEAGIDYISTLDKMGLTLDDVASGTVNANKFIAELLATLQGNFGGAAERQATSWAGLASTFQDITRIGLREFFQGILNTLQPLAGAMTDAFSNPQVTNGLRMIGQTIGELIQPAIQKLTGWFEALPGKIQTAVQFLQQLKDELQGLSAADILAGLGPGLEKLKSDLNLALDALDRAHVGTLQKLQTDIGKAGDKLAEEMGKLAEKYAPDLAKLNQRISDATIDFNQRATDQAERFAKERANIEKRLTKQIADGEERLTELKKEHQKRRQELSRNLMFAETEEQYLQIQEQIKQEDAKYQEQKDKQTKANREQKDEAAAARAELDAEEEKANRRLEQDRQRTFRDLNQALEELNGKRAEEEAKLQKAYNAQVDLLKTRIDQENAAYDQQRADLKTAFEQQMTDLEANTIARAEAIGKGMAHTIASFLKDIKAGFDENGLMGVFDMAIKRLDEWANSESTQALLQTMGEKLGQSFIDGILAIDFTSPIGGYLSQSINNAVDSVLDAAQALARGFIDAIYTYLTGQEPTEQLSQSMSQLWRNVVENVIKSFPGLSMLFAQAQFLDIQDAIGDQSWSDIGKNILEGITSGFTDAAKNAGDQVKQGAGDLLDAIKGFFKIGSPSQVFADEVGANLAAGIGEGFKAGMGDVAKQARAALEGLAPEKLQPALATIRPVHFSQTNFLPAAPNGFDRGGLLKEIDERTLSLLQELYST